MAQTLSDQDKLARDEARRISQHERVKGKVREDVDQRIERTAEHAPSEGQVATLSRDLQHKAIREVADTETELARGKRVARLSQVVDYIFYIVYGIVGLQIALEALGAREESGFKQIMNAISGPLVRPFTNLMPDPAVGSSRLMLSYIIGLAVYLLLHLALRGLLRLLVFRKTTI